MNALTLATVQWVRQAAPADAVPLVERTARLLCAHHDWAACVLLYEQCALVLHARRLGREAARLWAEAAARVCHDALRAATLYGKASSAALLDGDAAAAASYQAQRGALLVVHGTWVAAAYAFVAARVLVETDAARSRALVVHAALCYVRGGCAEEASILVSAHTQDPLLLWALREIEHHAYARRYLCAAASEYDWGLARLLEARVTQLPRETAASGQS